MLLLLLLFLTAAAVLSSTVCAIATAPVVDDVTAADFSDAITDIIAAGPMLLLPSCSY